MKQEPRDPDLARTPDVSRADADGGVVAQLLSLLRALRVSPYRSRLALLAIGSVVIVCANAAGQIRLNIWQRDSFNALEQMHVPAFTTQLLVFALIAGGLLVLVVA